MRFLPKQTNPELPVVGEAIWVSGGRLPVTFRLAVHAVRRIRAQRCSTGRSPRSKPTDSTSATTCPGSISACPAASRSDINVILLDPVTGEVYQPLTHRSRQLFNHCLCSPPWVIQQDLRIGETRLMQIAYPELPADVAYVDVSLATLPPFVHVPVSPIGTAPVARQPTNLAPVSGPSGRRHHTDRVPLRRRADATAEHPDRSGRGGARPNLSGVDPAVGLGPEHLPAPAVRAAGLQPAAGRCLRAEQQPSERPLISLTTPRGRERWSTLWVATEIYRQPAYECLCTELGLWSSGLRDAGGAARLTGNYPDLPPGTREVDIVLPGFGTFRQGAGGRCAGLGGGRAARPIVADTGQWSYLVEDPPRGWSTADWPTDLPDPAQLGEYQSIVERISALPRG